ncbi:hypothetical protein CAI21_19700 [Alkalilimnicola ehrlichii]|uniref:UspA domain-containing protein n=1 Tax=Alkalilimnicola ehrlichii TaxID=351052 RepID=A0A3E0WK34_9GAMM|nr:universal stress protein [Alkalilimnicola ehrlichii]RFA25197.1 hypothetical protein CAI21_19700 [Alkalilimnicola ehrlichii]RFA32275.1 hypothetical protein CAL65_20120 [Alkalilimnicola ehrlichii]
MDRVIVAVNSSPISLSGARVGRALAEQLAAELQLYSITPDERHFGDRRRELTSLLQDTGIDLERRLTLVAARSPAYQLTQLADAPQAPLLCMATHARGMLGASMLGSVPSEVVSNVKRPVILVGPHVGDWQGPIRTVSVALDGSTFAESILPGAVDFARRLQAKLCLLRVQVEDLTWEGPEESPDNNESNYLQELAAHVQRTAPQLNVSWKLLEEHSDYPGDPRKLLVEYANKQSNCLLALTTHGSGLTKTALGSVAHRVIRKSHCPVLVSRPQESSRL